jgi:hypothetical protein
MTVDVEILSGTVTVGSVQTIVAGSPSPTWGSASWKLTSGQNYTATAWKDGDPQITSGNIPFST